MIVQKTNVLLIGASPGQARVVRATLARAPGRAIGLTHATRQSEGLALLMHGAFDVVLLDVPRTDATSADAFAEVVRAARGAGVVVLLRADEPHLLAAVLSGVHARVIAEPAWELDLERLLRAIDAALAGRRPALRAARHARVVSVLGAAGGSGTTTTALRLARLLAQRGASTVIAEMRSWPGALAHQAGVSPAGHLGALLGPDPVPLAQLLTPVAPRLRALCAPRVSRADRELDAARTRRVIDDLARLADRVVIELPCEISAAFQVACLTSALVVVVTGTGPAGVRQGRRIVELLGDWSVPRDRIVAAAIQRSARPADPTGAELGCPVSVLPATSGDEERALEPFVRALASQRADRRQVSA